MYRYAHPRGTHGVHRATALSDSFLTEHGHYLLVLDAESGSFNLIVDFVAYFLPHNHKLA